MELSAGGTFVLRRLGFLLVISSFLQITLVPPTGAQQSNATTVKIYAEGYCSMYGICGRRGDGKPDELLSLKIQSLCPTITGNVCCTADQFDTLPRASPASNSFSCGMPSMLEELFKSFLRALLLSKSKPLHQRDFCDEGAQNYKEWLAFIGHQANPNEPCSPYAIAFRTNLNDSVRMKPMNVTVYSCGDPSLGCSCGDCPSSSVCFDSASPAPHKKQACAIRIGSLKVKCLDVSLAILYFLLVSAFSVWCWLHRKQERTGPSRTKTLVNVMGENELLSVNKQEISTQVTQITLVPPTGAQQSNATTVKIYAEGYCSMYGICGRRGDGKVLNCPYNVPSMKAIPFLVGCPACLRNFLNLFCELSCSPNQSLFINVTSVMKVNDSLTVDGIDFYVTSQYVEELFNSCKDVKFGTMNTRAMDFVGAGAQNYKEWLAFIGHQANPNEPGSPYAIAFRTNLNDSVRMKPMNVTVYSCGDPSLGCSCGDCPSSSVCFDSASPAPHEKQACAIRIGSLKVIGIMWNYQRIIGKVVRSNVWMFH
ncbi:uncharacterized protein LOC113463358 [Phoenix dactylifera]|uniref:Uncharacterized protein LOC113463358 n=1 Tax=Phoenix dactylifera TaxID=42345 RepID=A0A8B8ZW71_PHODC|nr:uncharacterized protein LOC113463358 [Phoenix dactylifera]